MKRIHTTSKPRAWTWITCVLSLLIVGISGVAASAQNATCTGDTVINIDGVRLLNQAGSRTAGPFVVDLAPGVYRVMAVSQDDHGPDQATQPQEQWRITSNTGWASPYTIDIPDDGEIAITSFGEQSLPSGASSVTLEHLNQGGINSVNPLCVGFTRVDVPDGDTPDSGTTTTVPESDVPDPDGPSVGIIRDPDPGTDDSSQPGDEDDPGDSANPGGGDDPNSGDDPNGSDDPNNSGDPDGGDDPNSSDDPNSGDDPDDGDDPNVTPGDPNDPPDRVIPPTTVPQTDTPTVSPPADDPPAATPDEPIEPEVEGVVEVPGDVLARTGPTDVTSRVFGFGLILLGLGGLLVLRPPQRREV